MSNYLVMEKISKTSFTNIFILTTTLFSTSFLPWLSIRLPGLNHKDIKLKDLSGGRFLVTLVGVLFLVGLVLCFVRPKSGVLLVSFGAGLIGWFAGLALLIIGLVKGLIPNVSVAGVELSDGVFGQGPGVVLALGSSILLSAELSKKSSKSQETGRKEYDLFGLISLVVVFGLSAANHSKWIVAESENLGSQIAVSGDSLFGSVVLAILTWVVGAFAAGYLAGFSTIKPKVISILLIILSILKLLQLIFVWAGSSLLQWAVPDSVGSVVNIDFKFGFFLTAVLTLISLAFAVAYLVAPESLTRLTFARSAFVPSFGVALLTVMTLIFYEPSAQAVKSESSSSVEEGTNDPGSVGESVGSDSTVRPTGENNQVADDEMVSATAFVAIVDGTQICAFGSGAFLGDGTYVITNEHVVSLSGLPAGCTKLYVAFGNDPSSEPDSWYEADVLWADVADDLAILRVLDLEPNLATALAPNYEKLSLGSEVRVFGFPDVGGPTLTLTKGIISGFLNDDGMFYKVSAAINAGNSGGPVLDSNGRLIGIATAVNRSEVTCEDSTVCYSDGTNVGLVRPIEVAQAAIDKYVP